MATKKNNVGTRIFILLLFEKFMEMHSMNNNTSALRGKKTGRYKIHGSADVCMNFTANPDRFGSANEVIYGKQKN